MELLKKRLLAGLTDYFIIVLYALILFLIVTSFQSILNLLKTSNPIEGQLIGFVSLTLPVFLYFYLSEKGNKQATIGKQIAKIKVKSNNKSALKRNILKFLPWEIAHIGVHWVYYYSNKNIEAPLWVWLCLIIPQIVVFIYFVSIIKSSGSSSIYDNIAQTKIL